MEDWAAAVLDLVDTKAPIIAIGSSMGGSCAIEMARQAPNRIAALVLVGTKAGHRPEPSARDAYVEKLRANGVLGVRPEVLDLFTDTTAQGIIDLASSIAHQQHTDDLINAVRVFHGRPDFEHVLSKWRKPYLVVTGDRDPMFPRRKAERIQSSVPTVE